MSKPQLATQAARRNHERYSAAFWLDGSLGDSLKQGMASAATRILAGQIPETSRSFMAGAQVDHETIMKHFLDWLSRTDNDGWLVVMDNVGREYREQNPLPGSYDTGRYFPGADHGSILVTTRLVELDQRGTAGKKLQKAGNELGEAIFRQWYTGKFCMFPGRWGAVRLIESRRSGAGRSTHQAIGKAPAGLDSSRGRIWS